MDDIEWNVINEGKLFDAMVDHKPVGINKYFEMAIICEKLSESMQKEIDSIKVWDHLKTMYNLEALDESESIPFPNNEKDFALPEAEYGPLISKKEKEEEKVKVQTQKGRETPKLKEQRKEEKSASKNSKETPRRDSKDSRDSKSSSSSKKDVKKESEKPKSTPKGRNSTAASGNEKSGKGKSEDTPKPAKRPTRGSLKPNDDSGSSGKSSPITVTPSSAKRRRI